MNREAPPIGAVAVVATFIGCGPVPSDRPLVSVADSAGVTVVELGEIEDLELATLEPREIFSTAQTGVDLFGVTAGRISSSGEVLIGNAGNGELLQLDAAGALVRRIGRAGDGPGEFRAITSLHVTDEARVLVYDTRLGRLSRFDLGGELETTTSMAPPNRVIDLLPLAYDSEGHVLAIYGAIRRMPGEGVQRDSTALMTFSNPDAAPDTLRLWATQETSFERNDQGWSSTPVGFGRSLASAGNGRWAALGDTDRLDVFLFEASGRLATRIRGTIKPVATGTAVGEQWREDVLSSLGSDVPEELRSGFVDRISRASIRDTYPAFDQLAVDPTGQAWIGTATEYQAPERTWIVVARTGAPVGAVVIPAEEDVLDVRGGTLLTLGRDAFGVEKVTLYEVSGLN